MNCGTKLKLYAASSRKKNLELIYRLSQCGLADIHVIGNMRTEKTGHPALLDKPDGTKKKVI